jgi:hypothetical protein
MCLKAKRPHQHTVSNSLLERDLIASLLGGVVGRHAARSKLVEPVRSEFLPRGPSPGYLTEVGATMRGGIARRINARFLGAPAGANTC